MFAWNREKRMWKAINIIQQGFCLMTNRGIIEYYIALFFYENKSRHSYIIAEMYSQERSSIILWFPYQKLHHLGIV